MRKSWNPIPKTKGREIKLKEAVSKNMQVTVYYNDKLCYKLLKYNTYTFRAF